MYKEEKMNEEHIHVFWENRRKVLKLPPVTFLPAIRQVSGKRRAILRAILKRHRPKTSTLQH